MNINLSSHNFLNDTKASREFYWPLTQRGFFSNTYIYSCSLLRTTENKKVNLLVSKKYSASVVIEGIYKLSFYSFC